MACTLGAFQQGEINSLRTLNQGLRQDINVAGTDGEPDMEPARK